MPQIIKKPIKFKKMERTPEGIPVEEVKIKNKKVLENIEKIANYDKIRGRSYGTTPRESIVASAKFLAKEVYITSAFINRLSKLTKRKIIVVPIVRTGLMYTTYIKENNQVKIIPLEYPSSREFFNPLHISKLNRILENNKEALLVFVDASRSNRMSAALGGSWALNEDYTHHTSSILGQLKKNNKNFKIVTYNYAKEGIESYYAYKYMDKINRNFLPKYTPQNLKEINAILFNPSIEQNKIIAYDQRTLMDNSSFYGEIKWRSAPHDDRPEFQTKEFQDLVLHFTNQLKKSYAKK